LSEISIYTTTEEGAIALEDVMKKIEKEFQGDIGVDGTADADELKSFLKHVLPEFDEDRVYASDIKKLITWYQIIRKQVPESLEEVVEEDATDIKVEPSEDSKEA
jgi:Ribonuclease G/E